ncbi:Ulp1 protease family [Abeliophyllum distichum]|uniref:Ulp1 protease family n=1 Tax=Abeliophyllum distichum TaxID=126358 RepID=A0ABD1U0G6_9LAMI
MKVKKPSQWVTSPYTAEGHWRKHVDAMAFDLFREVDPMNGKKFSAWYNQLGDGYNKSSDGAARRVQQLPRRRVPKIWSEVEGVYLFIFSSLQSSHWYAIEMDIAKSTIFIYDPDRSCSTDDQIRTDLKPMATILHMLLKKINIVIDALAIERITKISK